MLGGEGLGDHPAHRGADHVGGSEAELASSPPASSSHVRERVLLGSEAAAEHLADGRRAEVKWVERPMSRLSKRTT